MAMGDEYADRGMPQGIDDSAGVIQPRWSSAKANQAKKPDVDTPSHEYEEMCRKWHMIDTVLGGTASMRAAGTAFLPRHQYESRDAYEERLSRATLKNYTLRTLDNLTSKAFRDPPLLGPDVPEVITNLAEDIDMEGNALHVFARAWFRLAVQRSFAFCLVDFSRTNTGENSVRTLEDDRREQIRPFWRLIDPIDVIFIRTEKRNGRIEIVEARIKEEEYVADGWTLRCIERIRILVPGSFFLYEKIIPRKGAKPKWVLVDTGPMGLDFVPLVPFYTSKEGLAEGKPPLEDLAYLNIEHFQSSADQRAILTVARFPILAVSGASTSDPNGQQVVIGPKKWLSVADPAGRIYYVEHAGNAIAAGRVDLEDIEDQMASYGSEFLRKRPGASSATGRALDSAEAISSLMGWGLDFKDALELAIQYTAKWLNLSMPISEGTIIYQIKPDISVGESKELDILDSARARRDISRKTYLSELQRRDILAPEFDIEKDMNELTSEPLTTPTSFSATISSTAGSNPSDNPGVMPQKRGPERSSGEPPVTTGS